LENRCHRRWWGLIACDVDADIFDKPPVVAFDLDAEEPETRLAASSAGRMKNFGLRGK